CASRKRREERRANATSRATIENQRSEGGFTGLLLQHEHVNSTIMEANKRLGVDMTPTSMMFEQVDGMVKADRHPK
ncbi:hypothetical protein L917_12364, partial [Phytophthora nicotianae]